MKSICRCIISLAATCVLSAAQNESNIVVIIADDLGYGDTGTFWPRGEIKISPKGVENNERTSEK